MRVSRDTVVSLTADGDLVPGPRDGAPRLWPFTQHRRFPWRSRRPRWLDPVNLMVLHTAPQQVWSQLAGQGWLRPDDGATHRTWIDGGFVRMHDHIALGPHAERVHVRLFGFGGHTLLAAHHEFADEGGHHIVTSWDRARRDVAAALDASGLAPIAPTGVLSPRNLRGVPGDGRVWRLVP